MEYTMKAPSIDVMDHFFNKDEHEKVRQLAETEWHSEKLSGIESRVIDLELLRLKKVTTKTVENFNERYEAFIEAITKPVTDAESIGDSVIASVEETAEEAVREAKASATEVVQWTVLWKVKTFFDNLVVKIAAGLWLGATGAAFLGEQINPISWLKGTWLWWILGLKPDVPTVEVKDERDEEETVTREEWEMVEKEQATTDEREKATEEEREQVGEEAATWEESTSEWTESLPKTFRIYQIGARLIYALNGDHSEFWWKANEQILPNIGSLTYNELVNLWSDTSLLLKGVSEWKEEYAASLLKEYQSETTQTLLRVGLSKTSLSNIIKPSWKLNTRLAKHFWETQAAWESRLKDIFVLSQWENFNWKNLTFQEISILYVSSLSALRVPAVGGLEDTSHNVGSFIYGGIEGFDSIENYGVLSPSLATAMWKIGPSLAKDEYMNRDRDGDFRKAVIENLWEKPNSSDIESLEDFITFKNDIKYWDFFDHPKLKLTPEQQNEIKEKVTTTEAIAIFWILSGNSDLNQINVLSLPVLLFSISGILANGETQNTFESKRYLWNYLFEVLGDKNSSDVFSEDEIEVLKIYWEKMASVIFSTYLWNHLAVLWYSWWLSGVDLDTLAIQSFVWWFGLKLVWGRLIARGIRNWKISIPWGILKKLGWAGMIFGAITWGVSWYTKARSWNFERDVQQAEESWDFRKLIEVLKKHQDSIKKYRTPEWKEIISLTYPGDTPFFVIEWKIYWIRVWEQDIISRWKNAVSSDDLGRSLLDFFKSLPGKATGIIEGVDYTKQDFADGSIIFGEWDKTHSLTVSEIFQTAWENGEEIIWQDIVRRFTEWEYEAPWFLGNEWIKWFPIQRLGNNNILFLAEIWTVDDIYQQ